MKSAKLSPAVLMLLQRSPWVDPASIRPTGPKGNLLKGDIIAHLTLVAKTSSRSMIVLAEEKSALQRPLCMQNIQNLFILSEQPCLDPLNCKQDILPN